MTFRFWSDSNKEALKTLKPQLSLRDWTDLEPADRQTVLTYFLNKGWFGTGYDNKTFRAINTLNENYKVKSHGKESLQHGGPHFYDGRMAGSGTQKDCCYPPAQRDFVRILMQENRDVVYELFSIYAAHLSSDDRSTFKRMFNDISEQFHLNIVMARDCFVPKQDEEIMKEVYEPVLTFLNDEKWFPVNSDLQAAFNDYLKATPEAYSSSVTHAISALQGFLQIKIYGKTGKGKLPDLLREAAKKGILQEDYLAHKLLRDVFSALMSERQAVSDAHPKDRYADEKGARLVLNLVMCALQSLIQG